MPLNEQGFDVVFDGRDLSGVGIVLGFMCKPAPLGCGTTDPGTVVTVNKAGELVYAGLDWTDPALARRSMVLMAEQVMPKVREAIGAEVSA